MPKPRAMQNTEQLSPATSDVEDPHFPSKRHLPQTSALRPSGHPQGEQSAQQANPACTGEIALRCQPRFKTPLRHRLKVEAIVMRRIKAAQVGRHLLDLEATALAATEVPKLISQTDHPLAEREGRVPFACDKNPTDLITRWP